MKSIRLLFALLLTAICFNAKALETGQTIRLINNNKSVITVNSSLDENKPAVLWKETNVNSQRWTLEAKSNGTFLLSNDYTGLYLAGLTSGISGRVGQLKKSTTTSKGSWEFVPVEGTSDRYYIYQGTTRKYALAVPATRKEGDTLTIVNTLDENNPVPAARITWTVRVVNQMEKAFTKDKRDDMMKKWKDRCYKQASTGWVIGNGGWWGDAEMFEIVLDALETTGDQQYATMFDNLYKNFIYRNKSIWYQQGVSGYNAYNDDIAWMCIACVRAYLLTGKQDYLTTSKTNFDGMFARADCYGNDLLQWKHSSTSRGTNSCINGPAAVCACYLAIAEADTSYYQKARKTYMAERRTLFEMSNGKPTGAVWDSYDQATGNYNKWCSTYNQGTNLGAAIMLYNHYGDQMFKDDADAIIRWSEANMANSKGIIHVCQTVSGDLCGFKGIMLRYLRMYAESFNDPSHYAWIAKNAYHAWNNRNSAGITSSAWLTKAEEDFKHQEGSELKNFGNEGNMTCISAAFNCHLGVVDYHDAYAQNEAEDFNFVRNAPVTYNNNLDEDGGGKVGPMKDNYYIGYRRVDFGSKPASHLNLRIRMVTQNTKLEVYLDQPNEEQGTLLCTVVGEELSALSTWETIQKMINVPVTGIHNLYFKSQTTNASDAVHINWWQFQSLNAVYADLTNNNGTLTASFSPSNPDALIDDDLSSVCNGSIEEGSNAWIMYQSPSPMFIYGYQFFSGKDKDSNPKGWALQASNDGQNWETLHSVSDLSFSVQAECFTADIQASKAYTHYRLLFEKKEDAQSSLSISEWQLLGRCINELDLTADGGTTEEGQEALIDHIGTTVFTAPIAAVYHPAGNYKLTAYSITAETASLAPVSWKLEGSADGRKYEIIDEQTEAVFPYDNCTNVYRVNPATSYLHYRLTVSGNAEQPEDNGRITQWQLFGKPDYGIYYADATSIATILSSDGSDAEPLIDDDGATYSTVSGETPYWDLLFPIPVKALGLSFVNANNAELDPKSVIIYGIDDDGTEMQISTKTPTFKARGFRYTSSITASKLFKHFRLQVNGEETSSIRLADIELYGTAIATADDEGFFPPTTVEASEKGLSSTELINRIYDGKYATTYRAAFTEPVSITYTYEQPVSINAYSLTASRNEPTRDPAGWVLEGSNDGQTWTQLDYQAGQTFAQRYATQFYFTENSEPYTNYRLTINAVNGANQLQIGQLQLLNIKPVDPTPIVSPRGDTGTGAYASIHTIDGIKVERPQKGINIVRTVGSDGKMTVRKLLVK
jgi:predicted alpha-1,6-mannanase (GH76 family)